MTNDLIAKPLRRLRIRLRDRAAEIAAKRKAEQAAQISVTHKDLLPVEDVAGYDPYGRAKQTPRFQPGERKSVRPLEIGGTNAQNRDPFGGVSRRRG